MSLPSATLSSPSPSVRFAAEARLPTRHGEFRVVAFETPDGRDCAALVRGDVRGMHNVPTRLHSECFTGDVMGSLRCDCRDQLEAALEHVAARPAGVVLYLKQEGRGIGLANKIRAYALQDGGLDTVDANLALGFADDQRDYAVAAGMLQELGVGSVQLLTNNPRKIEGLRTNGVEVSDWVPLRVPPRPQNVLYLNTKRDRSGHLL